MEEKINRQSSRLVLEVLVWSGTSSKLLWELCGQVLTPILAALDDEDIQILRTYVRRRVNRRRATKLISSQGQGPYAKQLKTVENDIKEIQKRVNEKMGASRPSLSPPLPG